MKPSLGRTVYCIYQNAILVQKVYAVGDTFFMINPYGSVENSWEWNYDDYNKTWFTSLSKAKNKLISDFDYGDRSPKDYSLVKFDDDYYELVLK